MQSPSSSHEPLAYPFPSGPGLAFDPVYAELRDRPLARVRLAYGEDAWLATRYADVKTVMSDPRFRVARPVSCDRPRMRPPARVISGLFFLDPPEHTRVRSLVAKELSARRVERLRDKACRLADELLDRVVEEGSPVDLVKRFARPFAQTMLCGLLGVPDEDHHRFWNWAEAALSGTATDDELDTQAEEFLSYVAGLFELRRREPREDLFTCVVRGREADSRVTEEDMFALANDLLVAGLLTVGHQIAGFLHQLLLHPAELRRLRARPQLIPTAVEELLRYVPLFNSLPPRYATEDIELGGALVRAGEPVLVATAAANRDPAAFSDADALRLDRSGSPHLGLGHGTHYCLGAHLARMELQVALETVLRRLPGLRLAIPDEELHWKTGGMVLGLHALPVAFDRGTDAPGARATPDTASHSASGEQPGAEAGSSCPRHSGSYPPHP